MKILLLGFAKIKYMPYLHFYLDNIDKNQHEISLVCWNRDGKSDEKIEKVKIYEFKELQQDQVAKIKKISSFFGYKKYAKAILKKVNPDIVILLHTFPAVLLYGELKRNFKGKYNFDYRDFTYEKFFPFRLRIHNIVKHSFTTFVSSDGFRKFLPEKYSSKIHTTHNLLLSELNEQVSKKNFSDKIRIAFWGFIRHEEINRRIISCVAKDDRFELHYYGREQKVAINLKDYSKAINAKNVFFHGEYVLKDRFEFAKETDIIHNIYLDQNTLLAMGNKFYDCLIFKIPLLSMEGSFMGQRAEEANIGLQCNPYEDNFLQKVWEYFTSLNREKFEMSCEIQLEKVVLENKQAINVLSNFIK